MAETQSKAKKQNKSALIGNGARATVLDKTVKLDIDTDKK